MLTIIVSGSPWVCTQASRFVERAGRSSSIGCLASRKGNGFLPSSIDPLWNKSLLARTTSTVCVSGQEEGDVEKLSFGDRCRNWLANLRREHVPVGERVMRSVATASALPVAQYVADPVTYLHSLDPRVKQAWLVALVVLPSRAHMSIRLGLAALLIVLTALNFPRRIWQDQLRGLVLLSIFLFVLLAISTDGAPPLVQTRTPPPGLEGLPELAPSLDGYSYVIMKLGPVQLTRKGLALAATASSLSFTILQSATICLMTTTPEQLAAALRWYLAPSKYLGAPVDEIILTLLLSLRFVGLVFDEVRNIALAVVARGIHWKTLKIMETADTLLTLFGRLFKNLLNHAERISEAMIARGFKGEASNHRLYNLTKLSIKGPDKIAILGLMLLVVLSFITEVLLPM